VVRSIEIKKKDIDQPLGIVKSLLASIAKISKVHHFLVFETDKFLIAVDYYEHNRLVVRMGDHAFVYDVAGSQKRANSTILT
jgi:hypothetical protein